MKYSKPIADFILKMEDFMITGLYFSHKTADEFRVYGDMIYIFKNKTLLTSFRVPNNLLEIIKVDKKKKKQKINNGEVF